MPRYYGGYYRRRSSYRTRAAVYDDFQSQSLGGIDREIKQIFLNLPDDKWAIVFRRYSREYGGGAASYAAKTYYSWKSGRVKMSGQVADRLLNLVPPCLDYNTRFELVKKVRNAHLRKEQLFVRSSPQSWKSDLGPLVAKLVQTSSTFALPEHIKHRVRWLAEDDAEAAQKLLAAADVEEAAIRVAFLDREFKRIEALVANIENTRSIVHFIELPHAMRRCLLASAARTKWRSTEAAQSRVSGWSARGFDMR